MTCPECGYDTTVRDSRRSDDQIKRRRECLRCRYRFSTIEIDQDQFDRLTSMNEPDENIRKVQDRIVLDRLINGILQKVKDELYASVEEDAS